jgi:hypothetical protein
MKAVGKGCDDLQRQNGFWMNRSLTGQIVGQFVVEGFNYSVTD